ncbi:MAG TPA: isoprenylcysteine carboxylmethyltransferase family protein [Gemmatimonadales bacterium]|jgi:protein-S-isoprenylcysteine O-methyltransferase Ste14
MRFAKAASDPWVWGQLFLLVLVGFLLPWAARSGRAGFGFFAAAPLQERIAGGVPLVVGISVMFVAALQLGRNLTPATTPVANGELVERGIYLRVRHPIYLGVILALWGLSWVTTNWRASLVVGAVSWLYFDRKAGVEERKLRERFPGYADYARRVPKLVPRFRRQ